MSAPTQTRRFSASSDSTRAPATGSPGAYGAGTAAPASGVVAADGDREKGPMHEAPLKKSMSGTDTTVDAVWGEISEDGPNYRNLGW